MSEEAARFRERAGQCRRLARSAHSEGDRLLLEVTASELEAEAAKIEAEAKPKRG